MARVVSEMSIFTAKICHLTILFPAADNLLNLLSGPKMLKTSLINSGYSKKEKKVPTSLAIPNTDAPPQNGKNATNLPCLVHQVSGTRCTWCSP